MNLPACDTYNTEEDCDNTQHCNYTPDSTCVPINSDDDSGGSGSGSSAGGTSASTSGSGSSGGTSSGSTPKPGAPSQQPTAAAGAALDSIQLASTSNLVSIETRVFSFQSQS